MSRWTLVLALTLSLVSPALATGGYELDGGREFALGGAGLSAAWVLWHQASQVEPLSAEELEALDPADLPTWDRFATRRWSPGAARASDYLSTGLALTPLLLMLDTGPGLSGGDLLVMYSETLLLTSVVTGGIKLGVGRVRPLAYNRDSRIPDDLRRSRYARRSFPSGHTSQAFAGAVFTSVVHARRHPDDGSRHWVRAGALTLATLTGYLRVSGGHHFPSDVVAGAALGGLVGWLLPTLHERDPDPVLPATDKALVTPMVSWRLAF